MDVSLPYGTIQGRLKDILRMSLGRPRGSPRDLILRSG